jgi:hypothetical protein
MTRGAVIWRAAPMVLAGAIASFVVVLVVSSALHDRYEDSALVRIVLNSAPGPSQDSTTASNQLASQYTQLIDTEEALGFAAQSVGTTVSELKDKVSAGTVQDQNVLRVTARGSSADRTTQVANAVAQSFAAYIRRDSALRAFSYASDVRRRLRPLDRAIASARRRSGSRFQSVAIKAQAELSGLVAQSQRVIADLAERTVGGQLQVDIPEPADGASKTFPRPGLFAVVAAILAALLGMQLALMRERTATR